METDNILHPNVRIYKLFPRHREIYSVTWAISQICRATSRIYRAISTSPWEICRAKWRSRRWLLRPLCPPAWTLHCKAWQCIFDCVIAFTISKYAKMWCLPVDCLITQVWMWYLRKVMLPKACLRMTLLSKVGKSSCHTCTVEISLMLSNL